MKRIFREMQRLCMVFLMIPIFSYAQAQVAVTGKVTSSTDGSTLPGVNVVVKGTAIGTVTNLQGVFKIEVPSEEAVIVISSVGYLTEEVTVGSQKKIEVTLEEDITGLDEVVVIGYGTVTKKELTGAVAQVKSEELTKVASSDIGAAIQGKVAGVNVQASSGAPGENANIQIRGLSSSIEGMDNNPLYVVDGIPYEGDPGLSPNEIETLDILKDAASTAAYGTRGSAGVILITTKQGKAGKMKVSYNGYYGIQDITSGVPLMNFDDYMYVSTLNALATKVGSYENDFWTTMDNSPHLMTNDNNIMDVVQIDNAETQNHSLRISGGKENLTTSIMLNYFDQAGTLINSNYTKTNGRANINFRQGKLKVQAGFGFILDTKDNAPWGILYDAYKFKPYSNLIEPDALVVTSEGSDNDVTNASNLAIKFAQTNVRDGKAFNANSRISYELVKGLNLTYNIGANYKNTFTDYIVPVFTLYDYNGDLKNQATRSQVKNTSVMTSKITSELGANYTKKFGGHKFRLTGVYTFEEYEYRQHEGVKYDLVSNNVTVLNGATSDPNAESGTTTWTQDRTSTLIGILGRLQYDYKGKYLFTFNARRDGSSRFGEENRFGNFYGTSVGWNVSDESFWTPVKDYINTFKLRASWGQVGNDNFPDYSYSPSITIGQDYTYGAESSVSLVNGAAQTSYANPFVQWETSISSNIGADIYLFKNKLQFTAEYYNTKKEDMLFPKQTSTSAGAGTGTGSIVYMNIGNMTNQGVELTANYKQRSGKLRWSVGGTFTTNNNEITDMPGTADLVYYSDGKPVSDGQNNYQVTVLAEGYEAGAFFMMPTNGIVNTEEKLAEFRKLKGDAKMGDLIYVDQNGDGTLTDDDRVYKGSGMPEWEAGINIELDYAGFDFTMQWYASVGNEIINGSKIYSYGTGMHQDLVHQWSVENPYSIIPTNRGRDHLNYASYADIWVEDGSYLRLRNVILGYTLPSSLTERVKVSKCRVYLAAQNPITLTEYDGYDPEVGSNGLSKRGLDVGNYPVAAQYRAGVQIDF